MGNRLLAAMLFYTFTLSNCRHVGNTTAPTSQLREENRTAAPRVRKRLQVGAEMDRFAAAVKIMHDTKVPGTNTTWWEEMADTHLNSCPHGNWFFLPWHRAYLVAFEKVAARLLNDPSFVLPYWDWSQDLELPAAFDDRTSPLFLPPPAGAFPLPAGICRLTTKVVVPQKTSTDVVNRILASRDFVTFASARTGELRPNPDVFRPGAFEGGPHGAVHGFIGRTECPMGSMSSALDPIFWIHHANVDRIWDQWAQLVGPEVSLPGPPAPSETAWTKEFWLAHDLGEFPAIAADGSKTIQHYKVGDVVSLGDTRVGTDYVYDTQQRLPNTITAAPATPAVKAIFELSAGKIKREFNTKLRRLVVKFSVTQGGDAAAVRSFLDGVRTYATAHKLKSIRLIADGVRVTQQTSLLLVGSFGKNLPNLKESEINASNPYFLSFFNPFGFVGHNHGAANGINAEGSAGFSFDLLPLLNAQVSGATDLTDFDGDLMFAIYENNLNEAVALRATDKLAIKIEFGI